MLNQSMKRFLKALWLCSQFGEIIVSFSNAENAMSQVGETMVPSYDSLVYGSEKVSVSRRCHCEALAEGDPLARRCLASVKASTRRRPGLHHQARGTGVLRPINKNSRNPFTATFPNCLCSVFINIVNPQKSWAVLQPPSFLMIKD